MDAGMGRQDRRAQLAIAASCVAIAFPGAVIFAYPGVMGPHWRAAFGVGRAAVGATLFFVLAAVGSFNFPVGRWQERLGSRRTVFVGQVLCAASLLTAAFSPSLYGIYLWAFLVGASSCFVYLPALTVAQLWWPRRRGLASGLVNFSFAFSAAVLSPVLGWLLRELGYRPANLILAAAVLVGGGLASVYAVRPPATTPGSPAAAGGFRSLTVRQSLRTVAFWSLWSTWALQGAAGISMITLSNAVGASKGFSAEATVGLLTAFNLANGVSRLLMGFLSDRIGRRASMSGMFAAGGLAYFCLPQSEAVATVAFLAAVLGFAFGTLFTVSAPLAVECFGMEHFGPILGLVFTAYGYLAGVLGPWLSGALVDRAGGDPAWACEYLGAFCFISSVVVLGVKPQTRG